MAPSRPVVFYNRRTQTKVVESNLDVVTSEPEDEQEVPQSAIKQLLKSWKGLDLRFENKEEEKCFKVCLEPDLLRWMLLGCILSSVCTTFNSIATFGPELLTSSERHDFGDTSDIRNWVFFGQLLLWTVVPACLGCFIALRLFLNWFASWNWEGIVTGTMCYASMVIVIGQLYHLTKIFGGDYRIWNSDVSCSAEAWVLLGLNCMTTSAAFFLPLRTIVSWLVPVLGLLTYSIMKAAFEEEKQPSQILVKILLLMALSYLAWHGSARNEKHLRTEWLAIREVRKASEQIEEQQVSIQQKGREIQEKEREIQATTDLVRSLQTVTRALCDTMVHLTTDLVIRNSDLASTFFERDVEGMPFTDFLTKDDQARFALSISRAAQSHIPVCLPVTIYKQFSTSECHLVVVHRGVTELCYLVGIRTEKDTPAEVPIQDGMGDTDDVDIGQGQSLTGTAMASFGPPLAPPGVMPGAIPSKEGPGFTSVMPLKGFGAIDEDLESDFSFTTYPKADPPRPPKFTNFRARARTIRMILKRWNVPRDSESCCQYHTVLDSIDEAVECLRQQKCDPLWSTYSEQCPRCACMNQGAKCVVCGFVPEAAASKAARGSAR